MSGISDFQNGIGLLYQVDAAGTTILKTYSNTEIGGRTLRQDALIDSPLSGNRAAYGSIKVDSVNATGNIVEIQVNSINQIGSSIAISTTDETIVAGLMAAAINSFVPLSGVNYSAVAVADMVYLYAPASAGSSVNGHGIMEIVDDVTIVLTAIDITGGSYSTGVYEPVYGRRYFINASFSASTTSLIGATEISKDVIMRGLQGKYDVQEIEITSGVIVLNRTMAEMEIYVDTESGAGTDNLQTISTTGFQDGDIIVLKGLKSTRVTTVKQKSSGSDNINLANGVDYLTGDFTRNIVLQLSKNNSGVFEWVEISRTPNIELTIANMRSAGISIPVSGSQTNTLVAGGGTITLVAGTNKEYQIIAGTVTLSSSWTITTGGTPKDGDYFFIDYRAIVTPGVNAITILGIVVPTHLYQKKFIVYGYYDSTAVAWKAQLLVDFSQTDIIVDGNIKADSVITTKILDANVTAAKLATDSVESVKIKNLAVETAKIVNNAVTVTKLGTNEQMFDVVIPISFETGEKGEYRFYPSFKCQLITVISRLNKAMGATDDGTIQLANSTGTMTDGLITHIASATFGDQQSVTPSSNTTVDPSFSEYFKMTSAKTTAGGKTILILQLIRIA